MKKPFIKKLIPVFLTLLLSVAFTACGKSELDLSDEDINKIVNYSANVLQKYNSAQAHSLKELPDYKLEQMIEEEEAKKRRQEERARKEAEEAAAEEAEENAEESQGEEGEEVNSLIDPGAEEFSDLAAALGLENVAIIYKGAEITTEYPEETDEVGVFGITAAANDKLFVMHYEITNTLSEPAHISILEKDPSFRIKINEERRSMLKTLLLDDLATFDADFEPGETKTAVLVAEFAADKLTDIRTIVQILRINNVEKECIIQDTTQSSETQMDAANAVSAEDMALSAGEEEGTGEADDSEAGAIEEGASEGGGSEEEASKEEASKEGTSE